MSGWAVAKGQGSQQEITEKISKARDELSTFPLSILLRTLYFIVNSHPAKYILAGPFIPLHPRFLALYPSSIHTSSSSVSAKQLIHLLAS